MSDEENGNQEFEFFKLRLQFSTAMTLAKMCSVKCKIFKSEGTTLNASDNSCIRQCADTIQKNYSAFYNTLGGLINFDDDMGLNATEE